MTRPSQYCRPGVHLLDPKPRPAPVDYIPAVVAVAFVVALAAFLNWGMS